MTVEEKIKRRIEGWHLWDNGQTYDNESVHRRQIRLDALVRDVISLAQELSQNPPAKVTSFNKYEKLPRKRNRAHKSR